MAPEGSTSSERFTTRVLPGSFNSSDPTRIQVPVSWASARKVFSAGSSASATVFCRTLVLSGSSIATMSGSRMNSALSLAAVRINDSTAATLGATSRSAQF
jgi:hypothetical protein